MPRILELSAAESTCATDQAEIEATTGLANITAFFREADGTPIPGMVPSLASTGTGNTITAVDTVTNAQGRFRWTFASTVAEAKTLTASAANRNVTQTAAVTVSGEAPAGPTSLFASDFGTATGTGTSALRDTDQTVPWSETIGGSGGEVIAASGITGWPSTNALRVTALEATAGFFRLQTPDLSLPDVESSRWFRWYFSADWDAGLSDNQTHPIESFGADNWGFACQHDYGDGWRFYTQFVGETFANSRWYSPELEKGVVYRIEMQLYRVTTGTVNCHMRVYSAAGVLLYDDSDFQDANEAGRTLATTPELLLDTPASMGILWAGCNGISGSDWFPSMLYGYQGCFNISDDDWCGAYVDGEGPT